MNLLCLVAIAVCCVVSQTAFSASSEYVVDSSGAEQSSKEVVVVQLREDTGSLAPTADALQTLGERALDILMGAMVKKPQ
jgi:hypothetical protein